MRISKFLDSEMTWKDCKELIRADLQRLKHYECNILSLYLRNEGFQISFWFRIGSFLGSKETYAARFLLFEFAVESTLSLLKFACTHTIRGMVYVSSLEYYGQNNDDKIITEEFQGYIDASSARSSYPLGKRAAEYLCTAYAQQYGINVKIARLTQTFGAGISKEENRVFAQFARSIYKGEDIVLHTMGDSAKPYCYLTDTTSALFYILFKGERGRAYNVANPESYISIRGVG